MSFLKKVFGRKPGGSFLGNLTRGIGVNKTRAFTHEELNGPSNTGIAGSVGLNDSKSVNQLTDDRKDSGDPEKTPWYKRKPVMIGGGIALLSGLLALVFKPWSKRRKGW